MSLCRLTSSFVDSLFIYPFPDRIFSLPLTMDDNGVQLLEKKIKHGQKTVGSLLEEYGSLLLKQTQTATTGDSDHHSVKQSLIVHDENDENKQLMDIELAMESIQQQVQLALEQYYNIQSTLPASIARKTIQNDDNQQEVANVVINSRVELSNDDNNGEIVAKLMVNPTVQALFNGTLPDDFYLHLISVMGIQACLLSNRLVCSFWNELVLERCHNQKSLKLFETFNCLIDYGEGLLKFEKMEDTSLILKSIGDDLLFEGLETNHDQLIKSLHQEVDDVDCDIQKEVLTMKRKLESSKILTDLFPRVEVLVLCPESNTLINVEHLLQFYAEQLTSLTMTDYDLSSESTSSTLRAFSFPKLKSLNTFWFSPEEDQLLSLLPQLESLTIHSTEISLETLLRTGIQLQELTIDSIYSVYITPVAEFSKRQPINTNLRKFSFGFLEDVSQVLEFISQNMTYLECLKLDLRFDQGNFPHLNSLTSYLVPLQQLLSLTLEVPVSFFLLDDNQLAEIKPLSSVRQLKLLLWDCSSLPRESMDLFSRALFKAFPHVEQVLIAFVGNDYDEDGLVEKDTLSAFEDFAGNHPNVVKLFRSNTMSQFTSLPNAVAPLLGQHRQVYEEYIEEEELFGVAICQLTACLVLRKGEDVSNLKSALKPADRLTAMSNLLQLLESNALALTFEMVRTMIHHNVKCALKYDPSQIALFTGTCKCILHLIDCRVFDEYDSDKETAFLDSKRCHLYPFFDLVLKLVKHLMTQQFEDKNLFLQLCKRMFKFMKEIHSFSYDNKKQAIEWFKVLLKLADCYKTEQLKVLDNNKELLLQIRGLMDNQLKKFSTGRLDAVMREFIRSENRVYRVEMARALFRCCKSTDNYFN